MLLLSKERPSLYPAVQYRPIAGALPHSEHSSRVRCLLNRRKAVRSAYGYYLMLCSIAGSKCLLWVIYTRSKAEVYAMKLKGKPAPRRSWVISIREQKPASTFSYSQLPEVQLDQLRLFQTCDIRKRLGGNHARRQA